ncbi:MAG: alpha/beta hydrolase [Bacteroidaceae bacterium]|nr:alpha/beta hydrolase [Bacteroidaceae bacterium]
MKTALYLLAALCLAACTPKHSPVADHIAVSGGGNIYYEEMGTGPAVILLHGHSLDTRMWDEQFPVFAKKHRTIRLDFRGYGRSSEQREDFQHTHADDVLTVMDSLGIDRAHIVGLSMGSFVAGDMLAVCPQRLLSCTLVSGGIRNSPGPSEPMGEAESRQRDEEIAALKEKGIDAYKREWHDILMSSGGSQKERMRQPLWQMVSDWTAWQPLHKEVRLFYGKEAWKALEERGTTDVPTLIIRGENEVKDPTGRPREMKFLSHARFEIIPDCGHMLNMERPEEFNRLVLDFINKW